MGDEVAVGPVERCATAADLRGDIHSYAGPAHRSKLRLSLQAALVVCDCLILALSFELAGTLLFGGQMGSSNMTAAFAVVLTYLIIATNSSAFGSDILSHRRRSVSLAMRSVLLAAMAVILAAFFLKAGAQISRLLLLAGSGIGFVALGLSRTLFHHWIARTYGPALLCEIVLVDDCAVVPPHGMHVIDAAAYGLRCDPSDPRMLDRIGSLLSHADRVVVACSPAHRRKWATILKGISVQGEVLSPELTDVGPLGTGHFGACSTIVVAAGSLDLRQRLVKRALDVCVAGVAVVLLAPLFAVIAIAIKLDSPGPILFVQDRVGRGNRLFGIYKFRSMRVETSDHAGGRSTSRDDDRITRVGRFIRATSIDELPQLFNILKSDMSLVGPRPHALGSLAGDLLFWEIDERYWHRHVCKPGITGLAQVRGFRGATHHQSDLEKRLQADLEYLSGWTILRDISILFATLKVVVHRNAY